MTDERTLPPDDAVRPATNDEDPMARWVAERGTEMLLTMIALGRALKFYSANNKMVSRFFDDLRSHFEGYCAVSNDPLRIQTSGDTFFINSHIVRLEFSEFGKARQLGKLMAAAEIGEAALPPDLKPDGIIDFFNSLRAAAENEEERKRLLTEGVSGIRFRAPVTGGTGGGSGGGGSGSSGGGSGGGGSRLTRFELLVRLYGTLAGEGLKLYAAVREDRTPDLVRVHRVLRLLVGNLGGAEVLFAGLVSSPWDGNPVGRHAAHVSILAMLLGKRLGLEDDALVELGTAGFLHDVARMLLCHTFPDPLVDLLFLPEKQRRSLMSLPDVAVRRMMSWPGNNSLIRTATMVVFENRLDFSAKSLYDGRTAPHPFTGLIGVADRYDATLLSSPGSSAQTAVEVVIKQAEKRLHPAFATQLVRLVGLFPPATPVRLSSGRVAVVLHPGPSPEQEPRPLVLLLKQESGRFVADGLLNLAEANESASSALPRKLFGPRLRTLFLAHTSVGE